MFGKLKMAEERLIISSCLLMYLDVFSVFPISRYYSEWDGQAATNKRHPNKNQISLVQDVELGDLVFCCISGVSIEPSLQDVVSRVEVTVDMLRLAILIWDNFRVVGNHTQCFSRYRMISDFSHHEETKTEIDNLVPKNNPFCRDETWLFHWGWSLFVSGSLRPWLGLLRPPAQTFQDCWGWSLWPGASL